MFTGRMSCCSGRKTLFSLWVCLLCALCFAVVSLSFSNRSCCFGSLATASFDMCVSYANLICHLKIELCLYVRFWLREL